MKKIPISNDDIKKMIVDYEENQLTTRGLKDKYGIPRKRILTILHENNVNVRSFGRKYLGGKSESDKRFYRKNKKKRLKHSSDWAKENREHLREYHKKWREENKEQWLETKRNYERNRKASDPIYKLIANFRTAIYTNLKENNTEKNGHYFEILGYTPTELKEHLEKQFIGGICYDMSWENYGEWHVDHIIPISSFNFTSIYDEDFKKCWSLSNLQPLWGPDNIKKSNKIIL